METSNYISINQKKGGYPIHTNEELLDALEEISSDKVVVEEVYSISQPSQSNQLRQPSKPN